MKNNNKRELTPYHLVLSPNPLDDIDRPLPTGYEAAEKYISAEYKKEIYDAYMGMHERTIRAIQKQAEAQISDPNSREWLSKALENSKRHS